MKPLPRVAVDTTMQPSEPGTSWIHDTSFWATFARMYELRVFSWRCLHCDNPVPRAGAECTCRKGTHE